MCLCRGSAPRLTCKGSIASLHHSHRRICGSDLRMKSCKNSLHKAASSVSGVMSRSDRPVVSDELHVVSLVTLLDAVHTDGVAVCRITGVTPVGTHIFICLHHVRDHQLQISSFAASMIAKITCKNHALGSWCSLKSCTGTDLCSQPFQWHLDCSLFCYLEQRWQRGASHVSKYGTPKKKPNVFLRTFHCNIDARCQK